MFFSEGILHLAQDSRTRGHSFKLVTQPCKMEIRRNYFSVRVVKPWNSLPEFVVSSTSVQLFESRLDEVWSNISLFVFATSRSSVSNYQDLGIKDPMSCVRNFTMMMMICALSNSATFYDLELPRTRADCQGHSIV